MNRVGVVVVIIVVVVAVFLVFIPAVSATAPWPPSPPNSQNPQNPQISFTAIEIVTPYQAHESPSCAALGYGFGYWKTQSAGNATWSYQLGCPPKIPANAPIWVSVTTFTSNSTTTP